MAVKMPALCSVGMPDAAEKILGKSSVPKVTTIRNIASEKPKSPMRFTINALLPASEALFRRK